MLLPAIRAAVGRHRRSQDMVLLQQIGLKMQRWSVDNGEILPSMTNESFLATLGPEERAFLTTGKVTLPLGTNGFIALQVESAQGRIALFVDGSVMPIESGATLLHAADATRLAVSLANAAALRSYNTEPFLSDHGKMAAVEEGWHWEGLAGYGKESLIARVNFDSKGQNQSVEVHLLIDAEYVP